MLPFTANGFGYWDWESGAPSDGVLSTAHESTDCSGPLLMERFGGVVDLVKKATVVGGRAYYGNGVVADKMVSSVRSNGSDAARCTSFACGRFEGAVGVFTAPDICCCSGGSRLPYLASVEEIVSVGSREPRHTTVPYRRAVTIDGGESRQRVQWHGGEAFCMWVGPRQRCVLYMQVKEAGS